MEKPYVISAELDIRNPRVTPLIRTEALDTIRQSLDDDLKAVGKNTAWVSSAQLQTGINKELKTSKLPIVSLDDRYVRTAEARLGISRGVNESLDDVGYVSRAGYVDIERQLDSIGSIGNEVQLVDDVLFSGDMITWVSEQLKKRNITIGRMVCGVAIKEGIEKLNSLNIDVTPVVAFDEVDDEICERDFFVVPGSGRRVPNLKSNALYFDTANGKPEEWASLPADSVGEFEQASWERSLELLRPGTQIEQIGMFLGLQAMGDAQEMVRQRQMEATL